MWMPYTSLRCEQETLTADKTYTSGIPAECTLSRIHRFFRQQLNPISQHTSDIQHMFGRNNVVADNLSRVAEVKILATVFP